jgi:hypothetical protein
MIYNFNIKFRNQMSDEDYSENETTKEFIKMLPQEFNMSELNGNEKYLTENLFRSVCAAYPGVFNLDYLLTGNGSLLAEEVVHDDDTLRITETIDPSSLVNAALAAKDETIAVLREQLEAKDALIASLRQQIELLKQTTADHSKNAPLMVADSHENPK